MIDPHLLQLRRRRAAAIGDDPSAPLREAYLLDAFADRPPTGRVLIEGRFSGETAAFGPQVLHIEHQPEGPLPFADESFDAVIWIDGLRTTDRVPEALRERLRLLRPGGRLLADAPGGDTLLELRTVLRAAEIALTEALAARFQPVFDVRDAGMLLQRCGFADPTVIAHRQSVHYSDPHTLIADLRAAAAGNVLPGGVHPLPRRVVREAFRFYRERFSDEAGRVRAGFETLILSGDKASAK